MAKDKEIVRQSISLASTSMRVHELALQRWLNATFDVIEGYPVPVIFSTPMDANADFKRLWGDTDNNPFAYLLDAKDEDGNSLYSYPSNIVYPLISVNRLNWTYRPDRSLGYHSYRPKAWVTSGKDPAKQDVARAMVQLRPSAWDFNYQIDHYCLRPDTQAYFIHQLMSGLSMGGGVPSRYINVVYPYPHGNHPIRMSMSGNIDDVSEREPNDDTPRVYRTSFSVTLEGYAPSINWEEIPTLWQIAITSKAVAPSDLNRLYDLRFSSTGKLDELSDRPPHPSEDGVHLENGVIEKPYVGSDIESASEKSDGKA